MFLAHLFLFGFFEGQAAETPIVLPTRSGGISSRKFKRPPYWWEPVEDEDEPEIPFVAPIVRDPKPVPFHAFPDISLDLEGAELKALIALSLRRAKALPEPRRKQRVGRALKVMKVQKTLRLMKLLEVYERS